MIKSIKRENQISEFVSVLFFVGVIFLGMMILQGCSDTASEPPSSTFQTAYKAATNNDFQLFMTMMSKNNTVRMETAAKSISVSVEDLFVKGMVDPSGKEKTEPQIRNEIIDGHKACLDVAWGDVLQTYHFVMEDGIWKIDDVETTKTISKKEPISEASEYKTLNEDLEICILDVYKTPEWCPFSDNRYGPSFHSSPENDLFIFRVSVRDRRTGEVNAEATISDFSVEDDTGHRHGSPLLQTDLREIPFLVSTGLKIRKFSVNGAEFNVEKQIDMARIEPVKLGNDAVSETEPDMSASDEKRVMIGDLILPQVIEKTRPKTTEEAVMAKIQGVVIVWVSVNDSGIVTDTKVIKGLGYGLDENAVQAVKNWKFKPAMRDGKAVQGELTLTVFFD
ncbi:energy transducer TonB [bacterium]|nr:energy transducer TonB [candidate division CSSED10-310 bacterium]